MAERGTSWADARALAHRLGARTPSAIRLLAIAEAQGAVLAADLSSPIALPQRQTSAMDGWVVAGEAPWRIGTGSLAGDAPPTRPLAPGTARPTATGAALPPGALGVVRTEHGTVLSPEANPDERWLWLTDARADYPVPEGNDIRPRGEEVGEGELVLRSGTVLTPPRLALAASIGCDQVPVRVAPRVQVLVTGAEVVPTGVPAPGQVRDALGPVLPIMVGTAGAECAEPVVIGDDRASIADAIRSATAPLVIVTGGTAHGPADHLRGALADCGASIRIDGVRMRPGHPVMIATVDGRTILALPGNPLAAIVGFASFGTAIIAAMMGQPLPPLGRVIAGTEIPNPHGDSRILAVRRDGVAVVPCAWQGSGMVRGLADAEAFVVVPPGGVASGGVLDELPLPW